MTSLPLLSAPTTVPGRLAVQRRIQPAPSVDLSRMTRYRGGTYSHTVDTIVFADGTAARTDLIRLNPNIEAYSLDFAGIAPTRPSRYSADSWTAVPHLRTRAHEAEVDWILRNSYPTLSPATLSERLRKAGYPLGHCNIAEHEAIAGTQAAIWYLTNGLELDTRRLDLPVEIRADSLGVTVEFDGERQLGGYTVEVSTGAGATLRLQKSPDGRAWEDIAASAVSVPAGGGRVTKILGVGSTVSHHHYGRGGGYGHYRVLVDGDAAVADVIFQLAGSPLHRNPERTVYLYEYLLSGAKRARQAAVTPSLTAVDAVLDGELLGPFHLVIASSATVTAPEGVIPVRGDGSRILHPVAPHEDFYLRVGEGVRAATLTVEVPGHAEEFGGRVITGVVRDEAHGRCTPLALAVPAALVVEFDIEWG